MGRVSLTCRTLSTLPFRFVASASSDLSSPTYGPSANAAESCIRLQSPDLPVGSYHYGVEIGGVVQASPRGTFKVPDASHKIAWSSCASTNSNSVVFDTIRLQDPDLFFHLGDMNYEDRTSLTWPIYRNDINRTLENPRQALLYSTVPTFWMPDDHDGGGGNDHAGNTTAAEAAAEAWRKRAPYPTLELTGAQDGRYCSFDRGRVRYIMTDQRRYASTNSATDNASKTVLGATQKAWFKNLIENSDGYLIVWCSTRVFHANTISGHDSWGGFTTERTELCDHIATHAPGRVIVLTGDRHQAGIDDGTNCDYGTTSSPIICAMAAPLDRSTNTHGLATFSSGVFSGNGQFGVLDITDTGGDSITVDIAVKDINGNDLATLNRTISLATTTVTAIASTLSLWADFNADGPDVNSFDRNAGEWAYRMATHDGQSFNYEAAGQGINEWTIPHNNDVMVPGSHPGYDSDTEAGIVAAGVNTIILHPDNFINTYGGSPSDENNGAGSSYTDRIIELYDVLDGYAGLPSPKVRIYDIWPDTDGTLATFRTRALGGFRTYMAQMVADVLAKRPDIDIAQMHLPEMMTEVFTNTAANTLTYADWFDDNDPHGTPNAYLIAGAIMYERFFGDVPTTYAPATTNPTSPAISTTITSNWAAIAGYINTRSDTTGQNMIPGPICTRGANATFTLATGASGAGVDLTFTGNSVPANLVSYEYQTDGSATWRALGSTTGTVNITLDSDGNAIPASSLVQIKLRTVNANGNGESDESAQISATSGANVAPSVVAPLADQSFTQSTGTQTVDASGVFSGTPTPTLSLISPPTGVTIAGTDISVDTASLLSSTAVTLRGTNTSGTADDVFNVEVTAGAPATAVNTNGTQKISDFSGSASEFEMIFHGINPTSNALAGNLFACSANLSLYYPGSGGVLNLYCEDSALVNVASDGSAVHTIGTPYDIRFLHNGAGIPGDTGTTTAVYLDVGAGWQKIISVPDLTGARGFNNMNILAGEGTANWFQGSIQGITITSNTPYALNLNPGTAALFNSGTDLDGETFTPTGTFT